mmetsp:Transcript_125216/g.217007  ORF Transcript_125216/g.217007 Transcript_125216/m.217007 type:complete len:88 (+) Transcript_125216:546-809(+)
MATSIQAVDNIGLTPTSTELPVAAAARPLVAPAISPMPDVAASQAPPKAMWPCTPPSQHNKPVRVPQPFLGAKVAPGSSRRQRSNSS